MPCSSCKQVVILPSDDSGLEYTTTFTEIQGKSIQSSLIPTPHRPRGGWKLTFNINGQAASVDGHSAKESVYQAEQLFSLNGIGVTKNNLWFNANIQWLGRAIEKHQRVKLADLLELAEARAPKPQGLHERPHYPVSEWGADAFKMLVLYLTTSAYEYSRFLGLCEELRSWMNPAENHLMGSSEHYIKITLRLAVLKKIPLYTQHDARAWLVETMRYMGVESGENHWR